LGKLLDQKGGTYGAYSKIAGKIKSQITYFAHKISHGLSKPLRKFIVQMLYGIQASKDVKLSNIAGRLNEEIALIKTESRLSRNMGKGDLTERINWKIIREGGHRIKEDTVIAVDISDIDKPYAKKMQYLAQVRDGSAGEAKSEGYWILEVLGADVEGDELIPRYGELCSQEAEDFKSENNLYISKIYISLISSLACVRLFHRAQNWLAVFCDPNDVVFQVIDGMARVAVMLHTASILNSSPKGEGFSPIPRMGQSKRSSATINVYFSGRAK
jgi:hypothetical protein